MLTRWFIRLLWRPFETLCHWNPLVPIQLRCETVSPGVQLLRMDNTITRALSLSSGGYDYAVMYCIDDELLFDTGYAWASRTLSRFLQRDGRAHAIRSVVSSHYHEDHCGNNQMVLQMCPQARCYAHPLDIPQMMFPSTRPWYRRFLFGPILPHRAEPLPEKLTLSSGRQLQVIPTPGHTAGHSCLYDPAARLLFAGDLFVTETLDTQLSEVNGPQWIESLRRVLALDIDVLLDGHGTTLRGEEVREKLTNKLRFLESLRTVIGRFVARQQPVTMAAIVEEVFVDETLVGAISMSEGWMHVLTAGDFARSHLLRGFVDEAVGQHDYSLHSAVSQLNEAPSP